MLAELQERLFANHQVGDDGRRVLARAAGHGHGRQGRHREARDGRGGPAGRAARGVQEAHRGGARPRLPLARAQGGARGGQDRRLRPLALRGRAHRAGARTRAARGDRATVRRDQRVRGGARRCRHDDHQGDAAHLERGAEASPARRGSSGPRSTGSSTPAISTSGSTGRNTRRRTRSPSTARRRPSHRGT